MSTWRDPAKWANWVQGVDCPICRHVTEDLAADLSVLAELEVSRVVLPEHGAPMCGYVWMPFARRHVIELHELTAEEGAAFMRDIQRVGQALVGALPDIVKLNYELHGNTVPHLHLHVFPRYLGDPVEGGPITPKTVTVPVYATGDEYVALRTRLIALLHA